MTDASALADAVLAMESDAIIATDRNSVITFWNPCATRIFGFSSEEAVGQSLDLIIPANLRARHHAGYMATMTTGHSRYGRSDLLSVPALTKDGRRISVEFTIAMLRDESSAPSGTVAILRDVTKQFEEKLKLTRQIAELKTAN